MENAVKLDQMTVGQAGTIVSCDAESRFHKRLTDMGVIPGQSISIKSTAPTLGGVIEVTVRRYSLMLRNEEANAVTVKLAN